MATICFIPVICEQKGNIPKAAKYSLLFRALNSGGAAKRFTPHFDDCGDERRGQYHRILTIAGDERRGQYPRILINERG